MKKVYDHPLLNKLVDAWQTKRLADEKSCEEYGKKAGVNKSYVQDFEKYNLAPSIIKAADIAETVGKKFILVDIDFDEQLIQTFIQTTKN